MGLVDDHRVVAAQERIAPDLGQQQTVRDQTDQGVFRASIIKAHGVTDGAAQRDVELVRDPLGHGSRRDPTRLGVSDGPAHATPELQTELGQLGGLARARLPGHDDDLVSLDRGEQIVAPRGYRQLRRVGNRRDRGAPPLHPGPRLGQLLLETRPPLPAAPAQPLSLTAKALLIAQRQLAERRLVDGRHLRGAEAGWGKRCADGDHRHRE
jgi:hypothetical protein